MSEMEVGGPGLGKIHRRNNDKKYYCHFTGFLEGIAASGFVEVGEVTPLIDECKEFVRVASDNDADDIIQDFEADLLEHEGIESIVEIRVTEIDAACEKSRLNRFLGYCRGIACDGVITLSEAKGILEFIDRNPDLSSVVGVKQIYVSCLDAVEDGIIDGNESIEICEAIERIVGDNYADTGVAQTEGVANYDEHRFEDFEREVEGAVVVLTGCFKVNPRKILEDEIAARGAVIKRAVSGKTDYLIVGGKASRDWLELNRGTKIRKAQNLRLKSSKPKLVSEYQLLRHIDWE